jgi:putative flippase GtrA
MEEEKKQNIEEKTKAIILLEKFENFFLNILDKIKLKFLADLYRNHREGWRYLIFGALATVVNIAVYSIAFYAVKIDNAISNAIAWVIAAIFAYLTNKFFVFASKVDTKKELLREITSFFSCRLLTLIIDEIIMIVTVDKLGLNGFLMKVVANIVVIILNYIFSKIIIFKKNNEESIE